MLHSEAMAQSQRQQRAKLRRGQRHNADLVVFILVLCCLCCGVVFGLPRVVDAVGCFVHEARVVANVLAGDRVLYSSNCAIMYR